ncbi:phosphate/phosphite/phosphonate ABC transporter substrate-binding protein [Thermodesulfovibrio sp. 1176]|uniref:phosphate/phosphite/phosphonate ABC transporter substrate-binding protein n=2 Tax=unclassified Thermodesulfovibrio TaxID=2645936 RepID=UPI0024822CA1|nr:phosphate/phosphite/phosphonate ABC transporter substrate-binding protein [Thermodesulfovibrio sp. 1176]MDI1471616.1 phosphate/phosphite/phosphonate ABC transporter substrate-binding protein [Thermodesulfovibrio sp. 1176]
MILIFSISCSKTKEENIKTESEKLSGKPVIIGILSEDSPQVIYEKFYPLQKYIEKSLKKPVSIEIARDFNDLEKKIKDNILNLLIVDPATYCELKWSMKNNILPLVKPEGGIAETRSVFITKEGKNIDKIFDSLGKKLALGDEKSSFSYLIPLSMLKDVDISLKDFKSVDMLQKEQRIALSVLIGDYDIGAVSELTANKYLKDGLKIIRYSEPTPRFLIAHLNNIERDEIEKIKSYLLAQLDKEVLKSLDIEKFSYAEDRDFDYIRVLIRNIKGKDYIEYTPKTIKVAILPLYSPLTIYKRYDPLMRYLSEKTGYEFKLVIPKNFEEFIQIVSEGKVDFSYQNPYVFSIVSKRYPVKALAITIGEDCTQEEGICGDERFRGIIITRKDSNINKIEDLKGKKIMIVSPTSAGGFLSQKIYLEKKGFNLTRDFKLIDAKRQEKVIIGVYKGEADAGFIREAALSVWSDEVDISKIKILDYGEYLPNWPFSVVRNRNQELTAKVKEIITNLEPDILKKAKIKGFKEVTDKDVATLKKLSNK